MKILFIAILLHCFLNFNLSGQNDNPIQSVSFYGKVSADTVQFGIFLPPGYDTGSDKYPVIFHLHGLWEEVNGVNNQYVAEFYESRFNTDIDEFVIVFPNGEDGIWANKYNGEELIETNFIKEVIPYVEENYRIDSRRRIIEGWSAGAVGAMSLYAKYPDLFDKALILDGSFFNWESFLQMQPYLAKDFFNNDSANYYKVYPSFLIEKNKDQLKDTDKIKIRMVSSTFLSEPNASFQKYLKISGIHPEFNKVDCGHEISCIMDSDAINIVNFLNLK